MRRVLKLSLATVAGVALLAPMAAAQEPPPPDGDQIETLVRVRLDASEDLAALADAGVDVTHDVSQGPGTSLDATVIVPSGDLDVLRSVGATVLDTMSAPTQAQARAQLKGNAPVLDQGQKEGAMAAGGAAAGPASQRPAPTVEDATLTILRADRWTTPEEDFLSMEVRSELGASDDVTVTTDTGQVIELDAFVDIGVYLYHRMQLPAPTDGAVMSVTVSSSDGTEVTGPTSEWVPGTASGFPDGFEWGFTDSGYVDARQSDAAVEQLAADFPDLAEVVELPYTTHGYNLPGADDDLLQGPADYPRDGWTVKAIRIGAHRDGSRTGVMMYSQEHAREWVTSLVALETAQRLLHNYGSDPTTTALVDDLDIFIIPMINPDGVAYSLYDNLFQRTNLNVDGCNYSTPTNAGIDLNRNFSVGSLFEGYVGASSNCTSSVFAGTAPLSEAESSNEVWLTDTYENIEFVMNTHSVGGYFMWSPAAYLPDRTTLPRPDLATEQYFFEASETILSRIKEFRGTVVWPGRTGPVVDVLYSAAGNSGDEHFYDDELSPVPELYAWDFEVGAPLWDPATQEWDTGVAGFFWPDFATEGFAQAMEFANGWYGILEVARDHALDDEAPVTTANVDERGTYDGGVDVLFDASEPATVHYTVDGSRPTWDSPTVQQDGIRGGALPVSIDERGTTTLQWFSVDQAGNVEGGYDPDTPARNGLNKVTVKIR